MKVGLVGTRGIPARYGGFETAVEEIGCQLAAWGHDVVVYCRGGIGRRSYKGTTLISLPAIRHRNLETLSHTVVSIMHLLLKPCDAVIVFNAANALFVPLLKLRGMRVAVHVDGLEWKRAKWNGLGKKFYLMSEQLVVRLADEIISDARGIQDYYRQRYRAESCFIPYGAPICEGVDEERLLELGLKRGKYHLVVARIEPENHVRVIVDGYSSSRAQYPLVVVGSVPYTSDYEKDIDALAAADNRIRRIGSVWDQQLLNSLYSGSLSYLHGHSVGGTNPSLLRSMGAGCNIVAWDVSFNREVAGEAALFFSAAGDLPAILEESERDPAAARMRGADARRRAGDVYRWDEVSRSYEDLCFRLLRLKNVTPSAQVALGTYVWIVGPDGCGKSSLASEMASRAGAIHRYWRPGVLPMARQLVGREVSTGTNAAPHEVTQNSVGRQIARLSYYLVDYILGYLLLVRPSLIRGRDVVIERGWLDMEVDWKRYSLRSSTPARMLGTFISKPDYIVIVKTSAANIRSRKPELPEAEIARQYSAWKAVRSGRAKVIEIDNDQQFEDAVEEILHLVRQEQE